ncbi:SART-1 family protein DOT2 [Podospora aff. communis PSN243]|uniref:SART-1 family protein DOT2 n=1 Tax=Podospora aff. communis PSN243 TaxID=3040156 RepID=A0AAV9H5G4_9PEZI|nr:SART-1 family protein DOT2 [Podospora aff. communis PSN243]
MDAASIEEINKLRKAMGMKPLPVPGAPPPKETTPDPDAGSTIESREAEGFDNYRKAQEAEQAKRRREEQKKAVMKAREMAQRNVVLEGKGIADLVGDDELDAKSWLKSQKKRQKKIEATRKEQEEKEAAAKAEAEHTAADLAGVKVAHDMEEFLDADNQILTLKDTGVLENEDEGDELENLDLREREKLNEKLDLKKKKPLYDPNDIDETGERGILSHYDEEIHGKKKKAFTLDTSGTTKELADILSAPVQKRRQQVVDLDILEDAPAPVSDYLDASEVKVKKPKKKKSKSTRRKADDDDVLFPGDQAAADDADQQMEVDSAPVTYTKKRKVIEDDFADDDDLQTSLALQRKDALKKRKKTRPEDIARQLREEASQPPESEEPEAGGIVIDEITEFVDALQAEREEERRAPKPKNEKAVTKMEEESSDEDEEMKDADHGYDRGITPLADVPVTGVEEEKTVDQGLAATLALLKDRHLIEDQNGAEKNEKFRQRQRFLAELNRRMALFDEEARIQRERDRASGRHERMSIREREELARQQNTMRDQHQSRIMDQLFREGYKPNVELRYIDADGRSLDAKEAFKELSHQFHGKGSGKGKTDKRLKKLAEEKRRMAQSMLDASQNVGISTAASHQGKKRKEAGVRLA